MSLKIIVGGDSTDHGGKVISGSPLHENAYMVPTRQFGIIRIKNPHQRKFLI
jgi:hypothetical protein